MKALGYFIGAIGEMIHLLVGFYTLVLLGAMVVSWVSADPYNPIVRVIHQLTDPVRHQIRRFFPLSWKKLPIDLSLLFAMLILIFIDRFLVNLFMYWEASLLR
jgi:YggT family protein